MSEFTDIASGELPLGMLLNTIGRLVFEETHRRLSGMEVDVIGLGILWLVDSAPGQLQSEYARFQKRDQTTFGRYVDKLEGKALLVRTPVPDDRRARKLELTSKGREVLTEGKRRAHAAEAAIVGPPSPDLMQVRRFLTERLNSDMLR